MWKILHLILTLLLTSKTKWKIFQILWPSHNLQTLQLFYFQKIYFMLKILSNSALQWKVLTDKILKCFLGWPQLNKSSENKWPVLTGTVITTIFKPLQTVDQKLRDLLSALGSAIVEVCKNPAHFDPMLFSKRSKWKIRGMNCIMWRLHEIFLQFYQNYK